MTAFIYLTSSIIKEILKNSKRQLLSYINTLAVDKEYDECIVFTSSFHSPVEGGGAWEPDYDYENWEWYLGRTEGGSWDLLTWGY